MKNLVVVAFFALVASQLAAQAPPAPSEPDFLGANGATVALGGKLYTIKVEQILIGGQWDHNKVTVTIGGTSTPFDPAHTNAPVNDISLGIQIWVGRPIADTQIAYTHDKWIKCPAVMIGLGGNDTMVGTDLSDIMLGNDGDDTIVGEGGDDKIWAGDGNDGVYGVKGDNDIVGGPGNDQGNFDSLPDSASNPGSNFYDKGLIGGSGEDRIWGEDGEDWLRGEASGDLLVGGDGNDRLLGYSGNDTIWCGSGTDYANGLAGNDTIYGEADADVASMGNGGLRGGDGSDTIFCGSGADTAYGWDPGLTTSATDDGADTIHGDAGGDEIDGGWWDDNLYGDAGEDTINGEDGADTICGGADDDTLNGGSGSDKVNGEAGGDEITGGTSNDYLWGGDGLDVIYGNAGNDFIDGEDGNDKLYGEEGTDRIVDVDHWYNILDGGDGDDELACFDGNNSFSWDDLTGGKGTDTFWADETSADGTSVGDNLTDQALNEIWNVFAGPTQPADGTAKPVTP